MEVNPDPFPGPVVHGLEIACSPDLLGETRVNDIALGRTHPGETTASSFAIQHELVPGENLAEMVLVPPGMPLDRAPAPIAATPPSTAHARMMLQGDEVQVVGDEMRVTTHPFAFDEWSAADAPRPPVFPHRLRVTFMPRHAVPEPPWLGGERVQPNMIADQVYAETFRLVELVRAGAAEQIANAVALRRSHFARCYPLGPSADVLRATQIEDMAAMRRAAGFGVAIVPQAQGRLRVQAGGRLFDWVDANGEPAATLTTAVDGPTPLRFQFSLLGGRLQVTR